ncbi:MAG: MBL fold metallo-hydrolase [Chloroflexota bacterium]|nr:MBL fold metallo-hydrolase [Chloroflexota bacterium]
MLPVEKDEHIQIDRLETAPFGTNAYVIVCSTTGDSVLIDAPGESGRILERLRGTNPRYILITHGHLDHLLALTEIKSHLAVPVAAHPLEVEALPSTADILLDDGDEVLFGNVKLRVLHTPGHTPGSLCFLTGRYLISGDTLFPGGPGKTSTPADLNQIIESITTKLFKLPDDTRVYPGHGDSTDLGKEKREFAAFSSRPHDPALCGDVLWLSS